MSEMELMKYKITNTSENVLLASDIEASLVLPFCVFELETEDIPPIAQTTSLLKHYKTGKTLYPEFAYSKKQMFLVDTLAKNNVLYVLIEMHKNGCITYLDTNRINGLLYDSHRNTISLIKLLTGQIRHNHELPKSCTTIKSNLCFCSTRIHLPNSNMTFSGSWIQCEDCALWCHAECIGNLSACPNC